MYLLGVNLPDEKHVWFALTRIYGIGQATGQSICDRLSIHSQCKLKDLPESKITELSQLLNSMKIEAELRRDVRNRITHLSQIECYRGRRHKASLPVHGQRTRTNGKTAKRLNGRWLKDRAFSTSSAVAVSNIPPTSFSFSFPKPPLAPVPSIWSTVRRFIRFI
ncbi:uncharacterized protein BJ171DRAFT_564801 [Polychytrium aggregatum]|uniref:uncharacterized protein n=1 Tax=Polychytrium aggregatum TaxID=110093 RepID=UPI0022FF4112|nr:uncharacterized protein BJ171DRAFT_564801 [Polychytrium aggregatum]KAI9208953.1 hypothetical protein BJ171DRAFT_564801 [Polychytrium aggregatum]